MISVRRPPGFGVALPPPDRLRHQRDGSSDVAAATIRHRAIRPISPSWRQVPPGGEGQGTVKKNASGVGVLVMLPVVPLMPSTLSA